MFLRAESLEIEYGIDAQIAKFFVDREPPAENLYWKDKLLYLRPQPGYIFLPLITDLYYKSGISKETLLSEDFIQVLERIGHISAEEELGLKSVSETVDECSKTIAANSSDKLFSLELVKYFNGAENKISVYVTPFKALHRGDYFLFALSVLDVGFEKLLELTKTWFALISTLLLLDDAEDYLEDKEKGEANAFIESGSDRAGFERIKKMLTKNLDGISKINPSMAYSLGQKLQVIGDKPGIKEYLNA